MGFVLVLLQVLFRLLGLLEGALVLHVQGLAHRLEVALRIEQILNRQLRKLKQLDKIIVSMILHVFSIKLREGNIL